jgi:hypothetical protein
MESKATRFQSPQDYSRTHSKENETDANRELVSHSRQECLKTREIPPMEETV